MFQIEPRTATNCRFRYVEDRWRRRGDSANTRHDDLLSTKAQSPLSPADSHVGHCACALVASSESIVMGVIEKTGYEINQVIHSLEQEFKGNEYHPLTRFSSREQHGVLRQSVSANGCDAARALQEL